METQASVLNYPPEHSVNPPGQSQPGFVLGFPFKTRKPFRVIVGASLPFYEWFWTWLKFSQREKFRLLELSRKRERAERWRGVSMLFFSTFSYKGVCNCPVAPRVCQSHCLFPIEKHCSNSVTNFNQTTEKEMAGQLSAPPTIVKTWQLNRWEARICVPLRERLRHKLSRYLFDLAHQSLLVYVQCVMEIKGK